MKEHFTMLTDPRFCLSNGVTQRFGMGPMPKTVRLNREGFAVDAAVKKKTLVYPYMHLATHPAPGKGDLRNFSAIDPVASDDVPADLSSLKREIGLGAVVCMASDAYPLGRRAWCFPVWAI